MADICQQTCLNLIGAFGGMTCLICLTEQQRSLQRAADMRTQHLINFTIARAHLQDNKADGLTLKVQRFHYHAVRSIWQQIERDKLPCRESPPTGSDGG